MDAANTVSLRLTISNPREMGSGVEIQRMFDRRGGSIGSAASDQWRLSSKRTGVVSGHTEIRHIDGGFCLIDRSGRTYINSANLPVGRGRPARLSEGDQIRIGRYQIKATLIADHAEPSPEDDMGDAHELVDAPEEALQQSREDDPMPMDPLQDLPPAIDAREQRDALLGLDSEPVAPVVTDRQDDDLLADEPEWLASQQPSRESDRANRDLALGLPGLSGRRQRMADTQPATSKDRSRRHISGAPLLQGMDTPLEFSDSDEMRLFLEEAGQTLKATINGLLELHQNEDSRHQALRTRLQPIEDNPLRLGQSYDATMQTLFASERSPVHLSSPAAVSESLTGLCHHQQATKAATREALDAILRAFSPQALLRRFHGYRRGLQTGETEPAWAWEMYQHYYDELSSSRQQGFERLFDEVFEQAYDHHLRQLQRESML
jgi:type VI secretion system protein ImpI